MRDDARDYPSVPALPRHSLGLRLSALAGGAILAGWAGLDRLLQAYETLSARASANLSPGPTFDYPLEQR